MQTKVIKIFTKKKHVQSLLHNAEIINWKHRRSNKNDNPQISKEIIVEIVFEKKSYFPHFSSTLENLHENNNES